MAVDRAVQVVGPVLGERDPQRGTGGGLDVAGLLLDYGRWVEGVLLVEIWIVCCTGPPPPDALELPPQAARSTERGRRTSSRRIVSSYEAGMPFGFRGTVWPQRARSSAG